MPQHEVESLAGVRVALRPLGERAGRRRSLDQRLYVRFPVIYRLAADAVSRLPPASRLRRSVLRPERGLAYAAANRRDFEVVLVGLATEIEYRPSADLMPPDLEAAFHGHHGYLRLWRYWLDAFEWSGSRTSSIDPRRSRPPRGRRSRVPPVG